MATHRKRSRTGLSIAAALLIAAALTVAFWPRAVLVDIADVRIAPMAVTINEEGRTRVRNPYVVSAPVAGELQRVTVLPGDKVERDVTVVARMRPVNPSALNLRTREQANAAVTAAEAALRVARADLNAAIANRDFAHSELERVRRLVERQITSKVALERSQQEARVADANVETFRAAIAVRRAELQNARAQLIGFDDQGLSSALDKAKPPGIPLRAPIDGTILKLMHTSKTTLPAGEPILEIGDVSGDLEVVAELLSSDAVQVRAGQRVIITNWGGDHDLTGVVARIDPYGYTKISALGVEEQRVKTTIRFTNPPTGADRLGHGFRVEVRIVTWQDDAALVVPSSALFRQDGGWVVFRVIDGRARLSPVRIGHDNGTLAAVEDGLSAGERVILFPTASLGDGSKVTSRGAGQ